MAKNKKKKQSRPAPAQPSSSAVKPRTSDSRTLRIGGLIVALLVAAAWVWSRSGDATSGAPMGSLGDPSSIDAHAPARYSVLLTTTAGPITIDVHRAWSPNGADRFYGLVRAGYYDDVAFFRVVEGFMAQCGIHGRPEVNRVWRNASIPDDPVVQHNTRGFVSFATGGPDTRTTQFFISYVDNSNLDASGFSPFGRVRDMRAVDELEARYGEGAPGGRGPDQARIQAEGNAYLRAEFPDLDYIETARIVD